MNHSKTNNVHSNLICFSIGIVYFIFGILKFFPELSPAEKLAEQTIHKMTFGLISNKLALFSLASLETLIGFSLIFRIKLVFIIKLALFHMICTFFPFILLPEQTFNFSGETLTLTGQYILKNIIIISCLINLKETVKPLEYTPSLDKKTKQQYRILNALFEFNWKLLDKTN